MPTIILTEAEIQELAFMLSEAEAEGRTVRVQARSTGFAVKVGQDMWTPTFGSLEDIDDPARRAFLHRTLDPEEGGE